jgi:DNA-binding response OmpR family regulator
MPLPTANSPNLLIVDDDETIQRLLVIAAQDLGWRPVAAGSGQQALEILDPQIEAVILDHGLPGMNGLQTLARIREFSATVPVIMLTGLNDAETAVQALKAGANDYLTKPFELKRLFDIVRQAKNARKEASAAAVPVSSVHKVRKSELQSC